MSKESVNRVLCAVLVLFLVAGLPAPGGAQVVLVVGSVRDQHGAAIVGAQVSGIRAAGAAIAGTTDAGGTFSLAGDALIRVRIECRYCLTTTVAVRAGEPVVAIVRRYDALQTDSPSTDDLANLPYAHVESSMALRPFTLLSQSTHMYPGAAISDRGLSSSGSLLVDNGAPNYDVVAGLSPYTAIPAGYEQAGEIADAGNAFLYGDRAGGGTVFLHPFSSGGDSQIALIGGDAIVRAQAGTSTSEIAVGSFTNSAESRQRADGTLAIPVEGDGVSLQLNGGTEQGREYSSPSSSLADAFTFADATFGDRRLANLQVTTDIDRGAYVATYGSSPYDAVWSDASFDASIHSNGPLQLFADAGTRFSTGFYDAQSAGLPRIGATLEQSRADAGFTGSGPWYAVTGGIGMFWIDYAGGTYGYSEPRSAALAVPSLQTTLFPNGKWSVDLEGSGSVTLPTFLQQYQYAPYASASTVDFSRNSLFSGSLNYTDDARLRVSFEGATQSVRGSSFGTVTSMGLAATWQVAPAISLRAWGMHVTDTAETYPAGIEPYAGMEPSTGAFWATYDNGGAVRLDAIYRRDLLNDVPFYHVDGDVSGPITHALRWYAGIEDRQRVRYLDVGLRFAP
jgi:hypothetical protein